MVMLTVAEEEPPELLAQIVNIFNDIRVVGVPQIVPLLDSKVSPAGSPGLISHEVTVPPPGETVFGVINWSLVRVMFSGEYENVPGATSFTARVMVVVSEPPLFVA